MTGHFGFVWYLIHELNMLIDIKKRRERIKK
jgi:hypothetical protein